ncbi:hypothetical protein DV495_002065 [Geotrichum candidum]|uniref:Similar to Saccharomyces cerevisiae YIL109C SEC24 Component of the Sec23p-Sec24p heterodimer of the COPII vesicle coat n=1 Tax=Geotrichum candidum TaxID=1173061 RepID=A0A0J9XJI6_GEOCN|nr:hypothetical protein DV454_003084 [Geotrichum candidum]KAI9214571.1 hypothetical protein DS838_000521 [Geotrichum bryndzae]KAF5114757.1 hypothetical protein DV452_003202 [Geotrichum candidum]KAF5131638.1 hypothetical protein DV495_002065 [Geotrichum candidum]KAF7500541.1 hypothetical protein DV113_001428 [Geotrichum candidum]
MSQYGGYQEGYYQQQPGQASPVPSETPIDQGAQPSHHKKRHYPQQQYDFSSKPAAPAIPQGGYPGAPGYGAQPGSSAPNAVFTPAAQIPGPTPTNYGQPDQLAGQFGGMSLGGGAAPVAPGYGNQATGALPLNQLYNVDLLASIPPPITDLALPPPPVILPPGATINGNPEASASFEYIRSTLNVVPTSNSLLKKSKLPFAINIRPYTSLLDSTAPVVSTPDFTVCRCRRCRSYINPFVTLIQNRWKCNICGLNNDIPAGLFYDEMNHITYDQYTRPELNHGVIEFLAPPQYMNRTPQPPIYVFVLDVSVSSIKNGLLATAARTILESLDRLPNDAGETQVGFVAVDSKIHYFTLPTEEEAESSMLVISDLDDPFLPAPSGLLGNITKARKSIESLLGKLGEIFQNNLDTKSALGSGMTAAHKILSKTGGKIICLTSTLPNAGIAKLESREDPKLLGTNKETSLLQTASSFYKSFAIDCNKSQVSVDMFLFSKQYQDVASLSNLPRFTAGQTYFYPGWSADRAEDAIKFAHEFGEHLSQDIGLEAVMRVRCSSEINLTAYYGNFFSRSSDLSSFPSFPRDQSYIVEATIDETITKPFVNFQVAVLHTTSHGERRIRVLTFALPTSSNLQDIYASADQLAITSYFTHKAVESTLSHGLQSARDYLKNKLYDIFQTYKKDLIATNTGSSSPLQLCANLRMLPLLVNALIKNVGLRNSARIPSDMRSAALCLLSTMPIKYLIKYLHPDFFSLFDMPDEAGLPNEETGEIVLPPKLNLSGERLVPHGLYLIDDGQTIFIWIGRDVVPQLCLDAFGVPSLDALPTGKTEFPECDSPLNMRIRSIIAKLREKKDAITWPYIFFIKESGDPSLRLWASTMLIEDRAEDAPSYYNMLTSIRDKLNA